MIPLSETALAALTGSREGEKLEVTAWYDGRLTAKHLQVSSWSLTDDASRQVRRELQLTIDDHDGLLVPMQYEDPLAACGQRITATHVMGNGERIPLGEFLITKSAPTASWILSQRGDTDKLVCAGAQIKVTAVDLTALIKADGFEAPESPPSPTTAREEIVRLVGGRLALVLGQGLNLSEKLPRGTVYDKGSGKRLDALEDLVSARGGVLRMGNDAALYVEAVSESPVWAIRGGDDGVLIDAQYEQSIDRLYNVCVSDSSGGTVEVCGTYRIASGPLRWGGPLGRRIVEHSSPLITSVASAEADARTYLTNKVKNQAITLSVQCLNHPGLQSSDPVVIHLPKAGGSRPVRGKVQSISRRGTSAGILQMELDVSVPVDDFMEAVRG